MLTAICGLVADTRHGPTKWCFGAHMRSRRQPVGDSSMFLTLPHLVFIASQTQAVDRGATATWLIFDSCDILAVGRSIPVQLPELQKNDHVIV